jgi:capsular exopolysaccharide synthesis family protein
LELRDYVNVILKHWIAIVVITAVGLGAAAVYTFTAPKVYTAQAQTFIAISSPQSDGAAGLAPDATYTLQRLQSYINIIDSPDVLQPVIDELGLSVSVKDLSKNVTATNPLDTVLIEVSASNGNPQLAAKLANAVSARLGVVIQELETNAAGNLVPVKATLTNPATPPTSPSSPRIAVNLLLGFIIGLALGVGYAFLRESTDNTVKSPDEVADLTGASPLGIIAFDPDATSTPLVALDQRSTRAEAFRTIRTNLQYVDVDNPPQVVAITSAIPGEGKTTTALNLAITLAQAGKKVALVETDLRRPKASAYLGVESELGLTDVLAGQTKLEDALLSWNRDLLTFLPAGHTPPNPSELLASHQFANVLASLREQFDHVVIDATPLLPVTDGAIVSKAADGALLVVRFGKTTRDQVLSAAEALHHVDARVLGCALNFVPTGRRGYGYRYGYKYGGYGYGGYGYGYRANGTNESNAAGSGS